jgi:hypothetical protein
MNNQWKRTESMMRQVLLAGEVHRVPAHAGRLRVRSGKAWLSIGGLDHVLSKGDDFDLKGTRSKNDFGVISAEGGLPLLVEIVSHGDRRVASPRLGEGLRA